MGGTHFLSNFSSFVLIAAPLHPSGHSTSHGTIGSAELGSSEPCDGVAYILFPTKVDERIALIRDFRYARYAAEGL